MIRQQQHVKEGGGPKGTTRAKREAFHNNKNTMISSFTGGRKNLRQFNILPLILTMLFVSRKLYC